MFLIRQGAENTVTCRAWCMFRMLCALKLLHQRRIADCAEKLSHFLHYSRWQSLGVCPSGCRGVHALAGRMSLRPIRWNWSTQRCTVKRRGMSVGIVGYRPPRVKWSWRPDTNEWPTNTAVSAIPLFPRLF